MSLLLALAGGDVTLALTGQQIACYTGELKPHGQQVNCQQGTAGVEFLIPAVGQQAAVLQGAATLSSTVALVGQAAATATGLLGPESIIAPTGVEAVTGSGIVTPDASGDVTLALTGAEVVTQQGDVGAPPPATSSAGATRRQHLRFQRIQDAEANFAGVVVETLAGELEPKAYGRAAILGVGGYAEVAPGFRGQAAGTARFSGSTGIARVPPLVAAADAGAQFGGFAARSFTSPLVLRADAVARTVSMFDGAGEAGFLLAHGVRNLSDEELVLLTLRLTNR